MQQNQMKRGAYRRLFSFVLDFILLLNNLTSRFAVNFDDRASRIRRGELLLHLLFFKEKAGLPAGKAGDELRNIGFSRCPK